jgi:adenosine deaminase
MLDRNLPLLDLHRHLDGCVRLATVLDLGRQHGIALPAEDLEGLRPHVQVVEAEPDLMTFIAKFHWLTAVLADPEACYRVAYENVEDAAAEGIHHVELRFSPLFMAQAHDLDPAAVVEAVIAGTEAGRRDTGIGATLTGILSRHFGVEGAERELEAILAHRDGITALDLAGDEANFPAAWFVPHFGRARDAGLRITVHAGEAAGPESIWSALRDLGAERIGHATRAGEDPALLDYLCEHRVGIEMNLTSNIQTSSVPSLAVHPLRGFLQHGLMATINTDDPTISGIDLPHEYECAAPAAGLSAEETRQAQTNALAIAFIDDDERADLLARAAVDSWPSS